MATLSSKISILVILLCVYIYEIKGRPNNLGEDFATSYQSDVEESDLFKRSKISHRGEQHAHGKGSVNSKAKKKQVIDAYHLGPYHHGSSWGTVSQWPGFHWGGHPSRHAGWTGYPSVGGWHKSHIPRKEKKEENPKKTRAHQRGNSDKRQWLPTFAFPAYGLAYPTLGFTAVPFTSAPIPLTYGTYRSQVPEKVTKGHTRSSVKGSKANKRWWPGYMGGWGGWGLGNAGYPGWGPLGGWSHGYGGYGGYGHGYGYGWGGGRAGHSWGGYGRGLGFGWGYGHGYRSDVPNRQSVDHETGPKRQFAHDGFGAGGFPWGYGHGFYEYGPGFDGFEGYGPGFNDFPFPDPDYPFFGRGQFLLYPEAIYEPYGAGPFGDSYSSWRGHGYGFFKSKIPVDKSKKGTKKGSGEEAATSRHFVHGYHPGRYGWGGVNYPGHGYHGVFPLLGARTYGPFGGGYYGPHGPFHGSFGPYHRSEVPSTIEEGSLQSRQVINYNPGCYGWGGCFYPGCGFLGGWMWPLPCRHSCGCGPCWKRSDVPRKEKAKNEKGKSRQEITSPGDEDEGGGQPRPDDPQTHPHLEGSELMNSQIERLAMGFPGIESLQTPFGSIANPQTQGFSNQEMEANGEHQEGEPVEAPDNLHGMTGLTTDEAGNGFRTTGLGGMEGQDQPQSTSDLLSNFNVNPSEGPQASFSDPGNPNMDSPMLEGSNSESASRRTDIPGQDDQELTKKQAVAYPYHYYYPGYMMGRGMNPYYHYAAAAAAQRMMAYPAGYPAAYPGAYPAAYQYLNGLMQHVPEEPRHSHSIHVGAPNVNVDVQTTREHVAQNPEKEKAGKLKEMVGEFSKKLKFKGENSQASGDKKVTKRQISPLLSSAVNRPVGLMPFRYPGTNAAGFPGQSVYPSMQPMQPFDINAMSRSRLPIVSSSAVGLSPFRGPQTSSSLSPTQMAFSRQLSTLTGISVPIASQPGMGIVGMASRKRRATTHKSSKKNKKSTKRQFLAPTPTATFQPAFQPAFPTFALPEGPIAGAPLPAFPSLPVAHMQPIAFRAGIFPTFPTRMAAPAFSPVAFRPAPVPQMSGLLPFAAFPSMSTTPIAIPQIQRGGVIRGTSARAEFPQMQIPEGNTAPMVQEIQQREAYREEPVQMSGGEVAGFNPSTLSLNGQQSMPMIAEDSRTQDRSFGMIPQRETASFIQRQGEGSVVEAPSIGMQPGFGARKKSSVPKKKAHKLKSHSKSS